MSNIYIQEPPTTGKVILKTSVGEIDLELWTKEAPKACRNFIQLCLEGYYDNTIFHRVEKGFIIQGGDPTGTGEGGESIYNGPFKDEFHTRLRFCRRGLLAMANAGKDDNGSQFFFTLAATPELQNKHTIFGKVTGETIYNMLKLEDALVDENDRPLYPQKIIKTEVLNNPFNDIVPRTEPEKVVVDKPKKKEKKSGVKNFKLLSFGEEAAEDEEESVVLSKKFSGKGKSAHDNLTDPKLSAEPAIETGEPQSKKMKTDNDNNVSGDEKMESGDEDTELSKEKQAIKERIKNKLKDSKSTIDRQKPKSNQKSNKVPEIENEPEEEPYYLGKDRVDERKKKAEEIRKEIRDLKRDVRNEKKAKEDEAKEKVEQEQEKEKKSSVLREYIETQEKYKEAKSKLPQKGRSREDFTLQLLQKFRTKLHTVKEHAEEANGDVEKKDTDNEDELDDEKWMSHRLRFEEKTPVLAKDASTKDDDWFEIYDPRNPLNKRRRGEKTQKTKSGEHSRRR
ncbi:spliceosome-associated protein CWC27 homolog [Athalia rosae]|uniref:spliceosome-associated protein CWC27 homolog n=1 Tax=Athalia rosae TaxID=37344 RepID=UPI0020337274|nr:spliceosome-associated protein CWC27 homolog [Athalia rosae]